jgi:hypothetical protein
MYRAIYILSIISMENELSHNFLLFKVSGMSNNVGTETIMFMSIVETAYRAILLGIIILYKFLS